MPGWFPASLLFLGALFVIEAVLSLARGRAIVPRLRRWQPPRATWEFWSQLVFGAVFLLMAASIWASSSLRILAAIAAVVASLVGLITATVGLILSVRSAQATHSTR